MFFEEVSYQFMRQVGIPSRNLTDYNYLSYAYPLSQFCYSLHNVRSVMIHIGEVLESITLRPINIQNEHVCLCGLDSPHDLAMIVVFTCFTLTTIRAKAIQQRSVEAGCLQEV